MEEGPQESARAPVLRLPARLPPPHTPLVHPQPFREISLREPVRPAIGEQPLGQCLGQERVKLEEGKDRGPPSDPRRPPLRLPRADGIGGDAEQVRDLLLSEVEVEPPCSDEVTDCAMVRRLIT